MTSSLIIVDDFLDEPDVLRAAALKQEYARSETPMTYPGRDSKHRQIINGFDERVAEIIGHRVEPALLASHGRFRLALEGDKGTDSVHIDPVNWTVLLYLTLPEHCQDGTHLYRHIETNSDHAPYNAQQLTEMGFKSEDDFMENLLGRDTNDPSKWEHLTTIPMRYNRLVVLRPQQYHDAGRSFGDCPENGRLVYISTYY